MSTLSKEFRRLLEKVVLAAREEAERGAAAALEAFGVGDARKPAHLDKAGEDLRKKLRAHGRQVGDVRRPDESQEVEHLIHECAYEHWHRMLFARFLAENGFLIEPESGLDVDLDFCEERARETKSDKWEVAARFAQRMLPGIFRPDDPVLQLRLPMETRNRLTVLLASLPREVFLADDSLGWVYQFWQAKKKQEVNDSGVKIGADELAPVTQVFTEDYMVEFLLHNTLGAWWAAKAKAEGKRLKAEWDACQTEDNCRKLVALPGYEFTYLRFIREEAPDNSRKDAQKAQKAEGQNTPAFSPQPSAFSWRPAAGAFEGWPKTVKELRLLDPCMGSGHFLVFALIILVRMRMQEEGLSASNACVAVLRDNLFGLELDPRCAQIAAFNLALAAWKTGGYQMGLPLNLACSGLGLNAKKEDWLKLAEEFSQRNVRPHPGPLPALPLPSPLPLSHPMGEGSFQEREKHPPLAAGFNATGSRASSAPNVKDAATAMPTSKLSSDTPSLLPLPGGEGRGEGGPMSNLSDSPERLRAGMERLYQLFQKAPGLGSLINPRALGGDLLMAEFHDLQPLLAKALQHETGDEAHELAVTAQGVAKAAEILASRFNLIVTNVPYLGRGKQDEPLMDYCESVHPNAKADLATCFVERCMEFCLNGGSAALITPQNWMFLASYKKFREVLLITSSWNLLVRLGEHGFDSPQAAGAFVALSCMTRSRPSPQDVFWGFEASVEASPAEKAEAIVTKPLTFLTQSMQLQNADTRIVLDPNYDATQRRLAEFVTVLQGSSTGDGEKFERNFWEVQDFCRWKWFLGAAYENAFSGRDAVLDWPDDTCELSTFDGARIQGLEALGKVGFVIAGSRNVCCGRFLGEFYNKALASVIPRKKEDAAALWAFFESGAFEVEVRKLDQKLMITPGTFGGVPFDLAHWQKVAAEKYPNGLPKPFSSDPTQWLFNGHPKGSDHPLQVAVARLVGYRWPRQTGSSFPDCPALGADGLEKHADNDGVVCFSQSRDEAPAAERLRALLADAYLPAEGSAQAGGKEWGHAPERKLIADTGSKAESLEEWLVNDFFAQHCDLFHNHPFVWHIWDGRKDGFNVLVNYHKLAGRSEVGGRRSEVRGQRSEGSTSPRPSPQSGEGEAHAGRQTLESLTYAYLGDWITRQKDAVAHGEAGAEDRLAAALELQGELKKIMAGEPPYDLFVRWKPLYQQPIGWSSDINDGVRLNCRPFLVVDLSRGKKGAGLFRAKFNVKWDKDRGKEPACARLPGGGQAGAAGRPSRPKEDFPWFWKWDEQTQDFAGNSEFDGNRWNECHYTTKFKREARERKMK